VPALLYYFAVIVQVHFEANRLNLKGLPRDKLPRLGKLVREKGFLLIPLFSIIYLLIAGYTPLMAAFGGILVSLILSWAYFLLMWFLASIRKTEYCLYLKNVATESLLTPRRIAEAFDAGARGALSVACACACVGIVVGTGTLTGLALKIAGGIVSLAHGILIFTLFMTMCASILLGTGLPTTANFIVTSTMAAPALLKLDVPPIAAYMFVFYFGIAADLTPPVALAAYAGAGIAGDDPMKTGVTAFKLALAGFLVPYIYVYSPILLFVDATPVAMIQAVVTALIGVFLLAMCTIGFYKTKLMWPLRILAMVGAISLLHPGTLTDAAGIVLLVFIHVIQTILAKKHGEASGDPA
jgi:TRAP transporter 4TM/12TM fusion protein